MMFYREVVFGAAYLGVSIALAGYSLQLALIYKARQNLRPNFLLQGFNKLLLRSENPFYKSSAYGTGKR